MIDQSLIHGTYDALIVAHGDLLSAEDMRTVVRHAAHTIVCDGALEDYYNATHLTPDILIGDGDSIQRGLRDKLGITMIQVPDQETNDLTKSIRYAHGQGWRRLLIVGLTGKREDHTLANISLLPSYHRMGLEVTALTDYGCFIPFSGTKELSLPLRTQISFFAMDHQPLSASGVAYPFEQRVFTELWQATLNEVSAPTIQLHTDGIALIYIAFENKYDTQT